MNTYSDMIDPELIQQWDREHVWHPYSSATAPTPAHQVVAAQGVTLTLADGREVIDGMASWWCAIHGYQHPDLNRAAKSQIDQFSHVMFGGLTHQPAVLLAKNLVEITPDGLNRVFFSDSGSVSVEVALKMAVQFWQARGRQQKTKMVSLRRGYHGDTWGAMSVCDPVTGMHHLFRDALRTQFFVDQPSVRFGETGDDAALASLEATLEQQHTSIAALILEPIVQGAGGMWFYSANYLRQARALCDRYEVLLIADEIATGFGRTGRMFACEWADITPDILCLGKALTGGYISLAATLCSDAVANTICSAEPGVFMHGPTFMANPLACAIANQSIATLRAQNWQKTIQRIQNQLEQGLEPARSNPRVADVRVLGAIGVVETKTPVDMASIQAQFIQKGAWIRPFGTRVYLMPPYITNNQQLQTLCHALVSSV